MCACDEDRGRRFLAHQLDYGTELDSQDQVPVTLGFVAGICSECRGLPADAAPAASIHGRTSNISRYYWRELFFEERERAFLWAAQNGVALDQVPHEVWQRCEVEALEHLKALHSATPKYVYEKKLSQNDFLALHNVQIENLSTQQIPADQRRALVADQDGPCVVEEFVTRLYRRQGMQVLSLESTPFHVLFGVFFWIVIEDSLDPKVRPVMFGSRTAYEARSPEPKTIWLLQPSDFGSTSYAIRRRDVIDAHLKDLDEDGDLLWCFDYWLDHSSNLREYLWAHRPEDVARARELLMVLGHKEVISILRYLIDGYWERHLGWPDLLIYDQSSYTFAEVKFSKDKLSDDQRRWIQDNAAILHLPFKLIKVHKIPVKQAPK